MSRKYKKRIIELLKQTNDYTYNSLFDIDSLTLSNKSEHDNLPGYVDDVRNSSTKNASICSINSWLDNYFTIKENMEKYAPNLTTAACQAYLKENPFKVTPSDEYKSDQHSDYEIGVEFLISELSSILDETVKEDKQLREHISSMVPKIFNETTPSNIYSEAIVFNRNIEIFQNDFFKETLSFDLVDFFKNNTEKHLLLNTIYQSERIKSHMNNEQSKYVYSINPNIIQFIEKNNMELPLLDFIEATKKLNDDDKLKIATLFVSCTRKKDTSTERLFECLDFMAQTKISFSDKTTVLRSAILNLLREASMNELDFKQLLCAKTSKYMVEEEMNKHTINHSNLDETTDFKI